MRMQKEWYEEINTKLIENVQFDFGCHNYKVQQQINLVIFPELMNKKNITEEKIIKLIKRIPCLTNERNEYLENIAARIFDTIEEMKEYKAL